MRGFWHSSRTKIVTNQESRIANLHFSFRVTYSACKVPFFILFSRKEKIVKRVPEKHLESVEKKKQDCK